MDNCVFCKIIAREIPAEILYENEETLCILDINPIHFGHSLVIPKDHYRDFLEVKPTAFDGLLRAAHMVAQATVESLHLDGFDIFSNSGHTAGQSLPACWSTPVYDSHESKTRRAGKRFPFSPHITPRYRDDDTRFVLKLKKHGNGEMAEYGKRIHKSIHENP